jgi:cytochrome c-type biogenesis protein CcmE
MTDVGMRTGGATSAREPLDEDGPSSGDAGAAPAAPTRQRGTLGPEQRRQRRRLGVAGVVIVAAIGFLIFKGITSAIVFFKTANEAIAQRATLGNSTFQLEGMVMPGTVRTIRDTSGTTVAFVVESSGVKVAVTNTGAPPQLFQPGIPVVVVGHFVGTTDRFASDQILVKHSNVYIAAHPNRVRALNGTTR